MNQRVELVKATTEDGIRLDGALQLPDEPAENAACDAVLLVHGTGANFYASSLLQAAAQHFQSRGVATLLANTRGHDIIYTASTSAGPRLLGAAYERVADCVHDLAAWLGLLHERGFQRIGMLGHSLGAIKGVYTFSQQVPESLVWLCAVSPARLSYEHFVQGPHRDEFLETIAQAEGHVAQGQPDTLMQVRFPIPYLVTAAGYLDKYGPGERFNVVALAPQLQVPTLFTFGTVETQQHAAFARMPEDLEKVAQVNPNIRVGVIAGADHVYSGTRAELFARIDFWLKRLTK